MSQQQNILNYKEVIEKEISSNTDGSNSDSDNERIHDVLDRLNDINDMTYELLSSTLIGATVNKLKKIYKLSDPTIVTKVKSLIDKWKSCVATTTTSTTSSTNATTTEATTDAKKDDNGTKKKKSTSTNEANGTKDTTGSNDKKSSKKSSKNGTEDSSNNRSEDNNNNDESEVVETIIPENEWIVLSPQRKTICEKIYATLLVYEKNLLQMGMNKSSVINVVAPRTAEIEMSLYTYCKGDKKLYQDKARSIVFNLKKNSQLCIDVCVGSVEPNELVTYTPEQLANAQAIEARNKTTQKLIDGKRLDWDQANEDKINKQCGITGDLLKASLFTCGRCKSIKTTSTQKQTRSADEPMTVFVLCLNCGKRWKC